MIMPQGGVFTSLFFPRPHILWFQKSPPQVAVFLKLQGIQQDLNIIFLQRSPSYFALLSVAP